MPPLLFFAYRVTLFEIITMVKIMRAACLTIVLSLVSAYSWSITVVDEQQLPLAQVMVTRLADTVDIERDAMGYLPAGQTSVAATTDTRFTSATGDVVVPEGALRFRKPGFNDVLLNVDERPERVVMTRASEQARVEAATSNLWLSQVDFGSDALKAAFQLNCAFCHQQASSFMRVERSQQQWIDVFERMNSYGGRLPERYFVPLADILRKEYARLRNAPQLIPHAEPWQGELSLWEQREWLIGDGFSQMHDLLLHPNGRVYVGDNLYDRIYEINPSNGEYAVYKVPALPGAEPGGFLGNRFNRFPKIDNAMGVHSFAISPVDGNIFITPSMQQAMIEFDVESKQFTLHTMPSGFYPHTIRVDQRDRVWFTLAVSSQVAMFDRTTKQFHIIDLPARNVKERMIIASLPAIFALPPAWRPQPAPDEEGTGLPMPYGIDITPDGTVWVARLYANDIARIDPDTLAVEMIDFPYQGPRRLRTDAEGKLWIVAFQDGLLVSFDPALRTFESYPLPVRNEIPYALNVDKTRGHVWVNGNQSDSLLRLDIATKQWLRIPLPRARFFSRDVEIDPDSGEIYTTNSHFPSWQSEGGAPSLLRLTPPDRVQ
jgi:virginiamycin B lyase